MRKFGLILFASFYSLIALAGGVVLPTLGSSKANSNQGYAGLKWTLGQGIQPDLVIGVRNSTVKSSGHVSGGDASVVIDTKSINLSKIRFKYFNGTEPLQAEASTGYDFKRGIFVGVSGKLPYSNLGADFFSLSAKDSETYLMLDTLKKYKKPSGSLECPSSAPYLVDNSYCAVAN